jgi:hypothetical protein
MIVVNVTGELTRAMDEARANRLAHKVCARVRAAFCFHVRLQHAGATATGEFDIFFLYIRVSALAKTTFRIIV